MHRKERFNMKKRNKFFAALTAMTIAVSSLGMLSTNAAVDGPEMITDGSFEDTNGAVVYGFGNTAAVSGVEYSYAEAYEGNASAHITTGTPLTTVSKLGLTVGSTYNFSFYIKGSMPADNGMYLRMGSWTAGTSAAQIKWSKDNGFYVNQGTDILTVTSVENGWYKVEAKEWVCGSVTDDGAVALLNPQSSGGNPDIYIDNFSITDENGTEYVINGGFEPDTVGAVVTELKNTAAISGLEYATGVGYNDNSSIHITKGGEMTTPTKLGLTSGAAYNISFMIKGTLTTSNGMYLRMGWNWDNNQAKIKSDANGVFKVESGTNLTIAAEEDGWYKIESTTPWTCSDMSIGVFNVQSSGGTVNFYIDDFSITPASAANTSGAIITQLGNSAAISGLEYSNVDAYNSNNSIHITKGGEMTTPTKLELTSGATYNISFMIKGTLTTSNGMYLRMGWSYTTNAAKIKGDANGVFTVASGAGNGILNATPAEDGWYKIESTIPWTCSDMGIGFFNVQSSGGTVDFYIDNLSITESTTGTEMITDGGFETAVIGEEIITNGSFAGERTETNGAIITELGNTAAVAGVEYSTADSYDGGRAIHVSGLTAETNVAKSANLGMETGKSYNFSFYIKGKLASTNGMYIRTGWVGYDSDQAKIRSTDGTFTAAAGTNLTITPAENGWYKVESKTPWKNTSSLDFWKVAVGGGTIDFYIDNLSITESLPDTEIGTYTMTGETAEKTVTINVTNNGIADGYSAMLILATHKGDVMQTVAMDDNATVVEMGKTEPLTQTITVNDGETLTAFLWDSLNGMTPIISPVELISVTTTATE